jgi:hypothetical protein
VKVVSPLICDIKKQCESLKAVPGALSMRRELSKQTFKLKLLAFVLVLLLLWYSINPAPSPVSLDKPQGKLPEEKRREPAPQLQKAALTPVATRTFEMGVAASPAPPDDEDDFEWPEFIDA